MCMKPILEKYQDINKRQLALSRWKESDMEKCFYPIDTSDSLLLPPIQKFACKIAMQGSVEK